MQIEKQKIRTPIYVIDDVLPPEEADKMLQGCWKLEEQFEPAKIITPDKKTIVKPDVRQNDVVYLDTLFNGRREESFLLRKLEDMMFRTPEIVNLFLSEFEFCTAPWSTYNNTVLSRYGKCDFYGWHRDCADPPNSQKRLITFIYYVNTIPEKFTGGTLELKDPVTEQTIKVKPKHNRAVIFAGNIPHHVENVRIQSDDPKDWRFSFNCWIGFK